MKAFMDENFLLETPTAQRLFHEAAEKAPIFDFHCHLSSQEIWENKQFANLTEAWLGGDHYKWRAMRSDGIDESLITGDAPAYDKFLAWAGCIERLIGNPLYHWTHLELQRFFGITTPLTAKTAPAIWEQACAALQSGKMGARDLILRSHVAALCTTDDPTDDLHYHTLLAQDDSFPVKVLPAWRPDKGLNIHLPAFRPWVAALAQASGVEITGFASLCQALLCRMDFFAGLGCCASDHGMDTVPYVEASSEEVDGIFRKALAGESLTQRENDAYRTALLQFLGREYSRRGWCMELHFSTMRNNNTRMYQAIGPDTGFDSIGDPQVALPLSRLLDSLAKEGALPRTILFTLNPKDNYVLGAMCGNFQDASVRGKVQFGSAWWFADNRDGMLEQIRILANTGILANFVGMVTDSRSFLSYPRHEYFRRILCNLLGGWVENGEYPADWETLYAIVQDISFGNAARYFGLAL